MRGSIDEKIKKLRDELKALRAQKIALNVLEMVALLHRMGYEKIRIAPGMSASGMYWRCGITHKGNMQRGHGAKSRDFGRPGHEVIYNSGQKNKYFDWTDATRADPEQLAYLFLERFPEICEKGQGKDPEYQRWYQQMLALARTGEFPVAYADWYSEPNPRFLPTTKGFESGLPMPPVGEEEETE